MQTLLDIASELAAVQSALSHARQQQASNSAQITATSDIGTLADLHDQLATVADEGGAE